MRICKKDLVAMISKESGVTKKAVRQVYNALGVVMMEQIKQENAVVLFPGMVIFGFRRPSRIWENPLIGGTEDI